MGSRAVELVYQGEIGLCFLTTYAPDRCVKHIYGSGGSNYTKARIIADSPLIETYRFYHQLMEENSYLSGLTLRHAPPDMKKTFSVMEKYMQKTGPNEFRAGRKSTHSVPDLLTRGAGMMASGANDSGEGDGDGEEPEVEPEDLIDEDGIF